MFRVLVSGTFRKQFGELSEKMRNRIKAGLKELEKEPFKPRPNADIKPLKGTKPQKYRLRIADYRIVYCVESDVIKVIEIFKRGRGYRK